MLKIFYITGNNYKFKNAKRYAEKLGVNLIQKKIEIKEIQSNSIKDIAEDKAKKAFNILKQPLIVSDSGWNIPSLNGFPGPYMHYINKWFNAKDFLRLIEGKKDRSIILEHVICTASLKGFRIFKKKIRGKFIDRAKGKGLSSDRVIKLNNCRYTIAECQNIDQESVEDIALWKKVYKWLKTD